MHIEPGLVDGPKIFLSYATAATAIAVLLRAVLCTALVFTFFELMPHHPVGVSEVHLISDGVPASIGLVYGLWVRTAAFQGGIVVWVVFWAFYGRGFGMDNLFSITSFGVAYMAVISVEPLIDLGLRAVARLLHRLKETVVVDQRLYSAA